MLGGFMETLKKDWLALVLISVLICGITLNVRAEEKSGRSGYIEPKLVFPVISDVHIKETGTLDLRTFQHALTQLNEQAPKQDAFVVVGDLADTGALKEYDRFFSVYNQNKQPQAVSLFTIGNHEYRDSVTNQQAQQRFLSKTKMKALYFHQVIKGYHFIMLGTESRLTAGDYSIKQINWLAEQLKIAKRDDPKKPIFVFIHQPINNTLYGKNRWGIEVNEQLLYNTLKSYPQVITFSGHTHHPLDDPRTIFQRDFTSLATSSVRYIWPGAGYLQGELPPGYRDVSQGLLVEVYNRKVVVKRRDFHANKWTGEAWKIDIPADAKKFHYTNERDLVKPIFLPSSTISVIQEKASSNQLYIQFTQAVDNLMVHSYRITVKNKETGEAVKTYNAFSQYYSDPVPDVLSLPLSGLQPHTAYQIEVAAVDAFDNQSDQKLIIEGSTK